jgi:CheY-like chemotaxis protein
MAILLKPADQQKTDKTNIIVLVEDDSTNALMLDFLLQGERFYQTMRFQTMHFKSGEEVLGNLDKLKARRPALFLIDYRLPQMTGLDLYDQLRTIEELKQVPTIFLTAKNFNKAEKERIAQRNLTLLHKPFEVDDLLTSIQQAII